MTGKAFEQRNRVDFEKITQTLLKGIAAIRSDSSKKSTIAELARLTGVHRNTIRQRAWPQERLDEIKEIRRRVAAAQKVKVAAREDPVSILTDKLEKSRLEVIYWFRKAKDAEDRYFSKERESKKFMESKDFYLERSTAQEGIIADLNKQIHQLRGVIEILEAEALEKQK